MNKKVYKITSLVLLIVCAGCATATDTNEQSAEYINLAFQQADESFHYFGGTYQGVVKQIDDDMRVSYEPLQAYTSRSYKTLTSEKDGLRINTSDAKVDVTLAQQLNRSEDFQKTVLLQKELFALKATPPDFIVDNQGKVVRYIVSEAYKIQTEAVFRQVYDRLSTKMTGFRQARPVLAQIKNLLDNWQDLDDESLWPKEAPVWSNLSQLDGISLNTDGTPIEGVKIQRDKATGSLSFINRATCNSQEKVNRCLNMKFVRDGQAKDKEKSFTYLTVDPSTLKIYKAVSGSSVSEKELSYTATRWSGCWKKPMMSAG